MPYNHSVSSDFVSAIICAGQRMGYEPPHPFYAHTKNTQCTPRIDLTQLLELLNYYHIRSRDDDIGLKLGRNAGPGCFAILGQLVLSATSVGEGLMLAKKFQPLIIGGAKTECYSEGQELIFSWRLLADVQTINRTLIDIIFSAIGSFGTWATGGKPQFTEIQLQYKRPRSTNTLEQCFGRHIKYNSEKNSLKIPLKLARKPILSGTPDALSVLVEYADKQLAALNEYGNIAQQLKRAIIRCLPNGKPDIETIARALHMSPRTLQRKLHAEGISYSKMLQDVRLEQANKLLIQGELPLAEISYQLGYAGQSAFSSAYKQWTGVCPIEQKSRQVEPIRESDSLNAKRQSTSNCLST